jgi:hypothetical protein
MVVTMKIAVVRRELLFCPEDGGSRFLRNVCSFLPDYTIATTTQKAEILT